MSSVDLELLTTDDSVTVRLTSEGKGLGLTLDPSECHNFLAQLLSAMAAMKPSEANLGERRLMWMVQPRTHVGSDDSGDVYLQFDPDNLPFVSVSLNRDMAAEFAAEILKEIGANFGSSATH